VTNIYRKVYLAFAISSEQDFEKD